MATPLDSINRPIANIEAPVAAIATDGAKQDITPKLAQLVTGQLLKGEILSKLMDGSFTVRVAGITAKMILPEGSKTGDQIPLRLVSVEPRPTFLLEHDGDAHFPAPLPQNYASASDKRPLTNLTNSSVIQPDETTEHSASNPIPTSLPGTGKTVIPTDEHVLKNDTAVIVNLSGNAYEKAPAGKIENATTSAQQIATSKSTEVDAHVTLSNTNAPPVTSDRLSSTPTTLSNTGKFITQILRNVPSAEEQAKISNQTPIVTSATQLKDTTATAARLQNHISTSGLFYESHVAEWAQGQRPIADIKAEPQSRLGAAAMVDTGNTSNTTQTTSNNVAGQIIHQQLNVLEQNVVRWQGELFPGQKIEWEIKKDTDGKNKLLQSDEANWQSTVRFDLPNLGSVMATINLQSNNLGLSLRAENSDTVSALKNHAGELAFAMQVAGSPLVSFVVNKDEHS